MAIFEVSGGPITHKYLMGKTKHDLADMYMRLLRETAREAEDAERYRWLRDRLGGKEHIDELVEYNHDAHPELRREVDAAIDAARAGERG